MLDNSMNVDLEQVSKDIEPIIKKAGEILLSFFNKAMQIHTKQDGSIATAADIESEQYLKSSLAKLLPGVSFNAEESGKQGAGEYCFVIDPLDGTTNFSRGVGYFCVSVCLTHYDRPILAVIYQPLQNEYFVAIKGEGALLNQQKIVIDESALLESALTVIGLPYIRDEFYVPLLERVRTGMPRTFSFRHYGASALDLAYVASGRMNGVFLANTAWWDIAAGQLLVEEAGGMVTDFDGKPITPAFTTCLAGSPGVYSQLKELIS